MVVPINRRGKKYTKKIVKAKVPTTEEQIAKDKKKKRLKIAAAMMSPAAGIGILLSKKVKEKAKEKAKEKVASGFGAEFRKNRNNYLNDRSKKKTFEWKGNEYHVRIKDETPAMLEKQRKKTLSGAFSKKGAKTAPKKTFRQKRLARLKKRAAATTAKGRTKHLQKRIQRVSGRMADGGVATAGAKVGSRIGSRIKARRQAKAVKAFDELSFGQAFKQKRKELGKDSTFTWRGKKYTTVTKDDLKKKAPKKKTFKQKRVQRIKKRIDKNLTKPGSTKKLGRKLKRLRRVSERMADGGLATDDLGLRNRPEKRAVRAMKPGSGKSVAAKVKRTSVPYNKKNMDLAPKRRKGASIKGYQGGGVADKIAWQEQQPAARISTRGPYASGRPHKVAGFGAINPNEPTNVRQRPGGMKKGGMAKKPRGVGAAKRGYGKALS